MEKTNMEQISAVQASKLLGISADKLDILEKQGLLHVTKREGKEKLYLAEEIERIKSRHGLTLAEEAAQVGAQIQHEIVSSIKAHRKVLMLVGSVLSGYALTIAVLAVFFIASPIETAKLLGIVKIDTNTPSLQESRGKQILGVQTNIIQEKISSLANILQPIGKVSLGLVKNIDPNSYEQVSKLTILDTNDVLGLSTSGAIIPERPIILPKSSLLQIGSDELVTNLNSEFLQGKQPGTDPGDIAIVGDVPTPVIAGTTVSGLTNANLSGSAGITNANLANSALTVGTSGPLSGGGSVALGGTLTLTCPTCLTGSAFTVSSTDTLTNKTIAGGSNTITGLTSANLTAGDYSSRITSGTYSIDITGSVTSAANFTGSLTGDVTGTQGSTAVAKINGAVLGTTTATSGNLLIGSGTSWVTRALSNDATIDSSGVLTLKNTGTAGTYGSALNIPVFVTDAQGRVTGVTNTAISGLTTSNFSSANISQWTNNSGYLTSEADTLSSVTGRGATTSTALTLNGGVTTTTSTALTLDSGTTGAVSIGTGSNAKTITIGNTTGATALNLNAGSGNINFTVDGSGSSGKVQIGNSGTTTPDLLVLDNGTADPTGINGGMYYNTSTGKFRCYEGSAWVDCISTSSGSGTGYTIVEKTADESTNTDTTLSNDTDLKFSASANTAYVVEFIIRYHSSSATPDFKYTITGPTGAIFRGIGLAYDATSGTGNVNIDACNIESITTLCTIVGTQAPDFLIHITGIMEVQGTAGTVAFQWAQNNSNATNTTVDQDSILRYLTLSGASGADLAELYATNDASIEEGDVVSLDPSLHAGIKKSQKAYDQSVLGIVSTNPGLVIGGVNKEGVKAMPIALSGRVPVKVSSQNGAIKAGDYLTTSSIPGVAMKAIKSGAIIGSAMTSFEGEGIGQILVFVKNGSSMGSGDFLTQLFSGSSKQLEVKKIGSNFAQPNETESESETDIVEYITQIVSGLFKNTVEFFGKAIFHSDVTFLGRPTFNKDTAGHALIKAGESEVSINFEKEYAINPAVTASINLVGALKPDELPQFAVYDINTKGFKIKLSRAAPSNISFSWIALGVNGDNESESSASETPVLSPIPTVTPTPSANPEQAESASPSAQTQ